ncbi:hypothetical protein EBB07_14615 [Paenibacillaceae bacterium]|nr:hypothetical protein EBB07_14615 [Paenibacillaceae bacterium]
MSQELILDEAEFSKLTHLDSQHINLEISNPSETEVDEVALIKHLKKIRGIDRIEKLVINYDSSLKNLSILSVFSNLRILYVYSQSIQSFVGIEWFNKGEYIKIQTHRNRRRDISQLSQLTVENIDLYVEKAEDLEVIAGHKHFNIVDIFQSMEIDLSKWRDVIFNNLSFKKCKFKEFGNTAAIVGLNAINILGCRSLERFTGDNSNIKRLIVDGCKKLDLRTLKTFEGIEVLCVNSCTNEMNLEEIGGLKYVKHVDFIFCNVHVDLINLKEYFPNIESFHLSGMKKEFGLQLKHLNPDVQITSRSFEL